MSTVAAIRDMIEHYADALAAAERSRRPLQPLTELSPGLRLSDAYAIQRANVTRRTRAGERIVGHKIGLTARTMQELFGVDEPEMPARILAGPRRSWQAARHGQRRCHHRVPR